MILDSKKKQFIYSKKNRKLQKNELNELFFNSHSLLNFAHMTTLVLFKSYSTSTVNENGIQPTTAFGHQTTIIIIRRRGTKPINVWLWCCIVSY
jgi:hypothetical protein